MTPQVRGWFTQGAKAGGAPASWISPLEEIASYESSYNRLAVNDTPAGIAAGTPEGIMQMVPGTFNQYHAPGTSMNIFDAVANIASASRYIGSRYGNPDNTPGLQALAQGKPYSYYDAGGPLLTGMTVAVNKTGRTEEVLTPDERAAWVAMVRHTLGGGAVAGNGQPQPAPVVNFNYYGTQAPTPEQQAIMMRDLALQLG